MAFTDIFKRSRKPLDEPEGAVGVGDLLPVVAAEDPHGGDDQPDAGHAGEEHAPASSRRKTS
jgi:hypothetical protein